jgi:phage terminase large subunit-like protein
MVNAIEETNPLASLILDQIAVHVARKHGATIYPVPKVTLARYVVLIKSTRDRPFILDQWQEDLCRRLEQAFWCANANKFQFEEVTNAAGHFVRAPNGFLIGVDEFKRKENVGTLAAIHAPPQFGKSNIIAVAHPAWILGFDPLHRFRLATYNIMHSTRFSRAILRIIRSPEHQAIFPDPKGWLPVRTKFIEWSTEARLELNDGQSSFSALGLTSGFVGTGADTLLQDDPYASAEDARSETIRDSTWRFQTETAKPRLSEHSNNFIMFHRYHTDDQGGRAIASGEFELWRYPARADGDYIDEESGLKFPCFPLGRLEGECLSPRYTVSYYENQQKNVEVWNSQFQGRPTAKAGTMFDVTRLIKISHDEFPTLIFEVRAWDNAATAGGGDFSAGARVGIDASGNFYLLSMKRGQLDTGARKALQAQTAAEDGLMVTIHYPQDPGSAGKDMAFEFAQEYGRQGYSVMTEPVTGTKQARAHDFSVAVNQGRFHVVIDRDIDLRAFKAELRDFPLVGLHKDQVDACADAVTYLLKMFRKGRVIKSDSQKNILGWSHFIRRFGEQIPGHWETAVACRMASNSAQPSAWALVTRAAENAYLGEVVFVVASARKYGSEAAVILEDIKDAVRTFCANGFEQCQEIWLAAGNRALIQMAYEKFDIYLQEFPGDEQAGLPETGWYFSLSGGPHPFLGSEQPQAAASRCYILCNDDQVETPVNEYGQLSLRQDMANWSFNDNGKPQPFGGSVLDCVRMTLHNFWLTATALSDTEKLYARLPLSLRPEEISKKLGSQEFVDSYWQQQIALSRMRERDRDENDEPELSSICRAVRHERYHRPKKR